MIITPTNFITMENHYSAKDNTEYAGHVRYLKSKLRNSSQKLSANVE
jgi:hypothetical protein